MQDFVSKNKVRVCPKVEITLRGQCRLHIPVFYRATTFLFRGINAKLINCSQNTLDEILTIPF